MARGFGETGWSEEKRADATWARVAFAAAALALGSCAGGGGGGSVVPPPTSPTGLVSGLIVAHRDIGARSDDALGAPPAEWAGSGDAKTFDTALSHAEWSIEGAPDKHGATGPDGRFEVRDLAPGRHTLLVSRTLDGNLISLALPIRVGDDGRSDVVVEVSWGLARTVSKFVLSGAEMVEVIAPNGALTVTRNGRIAELFDGYRWLGDDDGDGTLDRCVLPIGGGGGGGGGGAVPPGFPDHPTPMRPPGSDDLATDGGAPEGEPCTPADVVEIQLYGGSSQIVLGQPGWIYASGVLSDGSVIDLTGVADWRSSNAAVATVDAWGTIASLAIGSTELSAAIGELISSTWPIAVIGRPALRRIHLQNLSCVMPYGPGFRDDPLAGPPVDGAPTDPGAPRPDILPQPACTQAVEIGSTIQFAALGEFDGDYYEDVTDEVEWRLAPEGIAEIDERGSFTGRQAGTTTLVAALGSVASDPTEIRVVTEPTLVAISIYPVEWGYLPIPVDGPPPVAGPEPGTGGGDNPPVPVPAASAGDLIVEPCVDCAFDITVLAGDTLRLAATGIYDTGVWRDLTAEVSWRSSAPAVATVAADGAASALAAGETTIDATLGGIVSSAARMRVVDSATLQYLGVYAEDLDRVVARGDQRFFKASGSYDVGFTRDVTDEAVWHSSDATIGTFEAPGVFTALAAGTVEVWAELDGQVSERLPLEVYEQSELAYCNPDEVNRAVWSDDFNRVVLESDCATYASPGVVTLRYTVTETQPHGGIFDPCLDLYVYQGETRVRTIREEGCGEPFSPGGVPAPSDELLKYQLRAFWDMKDDAGQPVAPGTYQIYGRFYLYYDPVVTVSVAIQ